MDIVKALRELYTEKKRLDAAIASLEARIKDGRAVASGKPIKGRRGRKSMSAAERTEVSRRMTVYWEARRAQRRQALHQVPPSPPPVDHASNDGQQASSTTA